MPAPGKARSRILPTSWRVWRRNSTNGCPLSTALIASATPGQIANRDNTAQLPWMASAAGRSHRDVEARRTQDRLVTSAGKRSCWCRCGDPEDSHAELGVREVDGMRDLHVLRGPMTVGPDAHAAASLASVSPLSPAAPAVHLVAEVARVFSSRDIFRDSAGNSARRRDPCSSSGVRAALGKRRSGPRYTSNSRAQRSRISPCIVVTSGPARADAGWLPILTRCPPDG